MGLVQHPWLNWPQTGGRDFLYSGSPESNLLSQREVEAFEGRVFSGKWFVALQ